MGGTFKMEKLENAYVYEYVHQNPHPLAMYNLY